MVLEPRTLGKKNAVKVELVQQTPNPILALPIPAALEKQVTNVDTSKDHETSMALENAIMLPHDVADLTAEGLEEFRDQRIIYMNQPAEDEDGADVGVTQGNGLGGVEGEEVGDVEGGVDEGNSNTSPESSLS
ncbi:hypothetical protein Acr_07g0017320 [Actinidia rufa]|uniref:Uncharacterized protein n=1 Tax=Actinidia rufa TaxID=165716 RepID=A0A7J0EZC8_9ERIC|nr:hypothetical protein Acr_07g0017320 [Actinidia rufa]